VPFVDVTVLRALAPMLAGPHPPTKAQLVKASARPLDEDIATRRKTGFPFRCAIGCGRIFRACPASGDSGLWPVDAQAATRAPASRVDARRWRVSPLNVDMPLYNRDLLQSLCSFPGCARVIAVPRKMPNSSEPLPERLVYIDTAAGGKLRYLATVLRLLGGDRSHDLVVCGHINLMPLAWLASRFRCAAGAVHLRHRRLEAVAKPARQRARQARPLGCPSAR
jgi:hypothetical protein